MTPDDCACGAAPHLIFACSGAADVGNVADQAARELTRQGAGRMFCLAGVGGRVPGILNTTQSAASILAIDGCGLDCTRLCLQEAGFDAIQHLRITDYGMEKGRVGAIDDAVDRIVSVARATMAPEGSDR